MVDVLRNGHRLKKKNLVFDGERFFDPKKSCWGSIRREVKPELNEKEVEAHTNTDKILVDWGVNTVKKPDSPHKWRSHQV